MSKELPIKSPTQPIVASLQLALSENGAADIKDDPNGYFTFLGAMTYISRSLPILKYLKENKEETMSKEKEAEVDLLIHQLETLQRFEW